MQEQLSLIPEITTILDGMRLHLYEIADESWLPGTIGLLPSLPEVLEEHCQQAEDARWQAEEEAKSHAEEERRRAEEEEERQQAKEEERRRVDEEARPATATETATEMETETAMTSVCVIIALDPHHVYSM
jgi:FtsZ-interacting cell division protein YlmF